MKIDFQSWSEDSIQSKIDVSLEEMKYIRSHEYETWKILTRAIELTCIEIGKSVQIK